MSIEGCAGRKLDAEGSINRHSIANVIGGEALSNLPISAC